jgi:hypothetical protein
MIYEAAELDQPHVDGIGRSVLVPTKALQGHWEAGAPL